MTAITTYQMAQADILTIIDRNPKLQPSTKHKRSQEMRACPKHRYYLSFYNAQMYSCIRPGRGGW